MVRLQLLARQLNNSDRAMTTLQTLVVNFVDLE